MGLRRLEGRVALVTGASRGIGRAVAERLARDGARLVLNHVRDEAAMTQSADACRKHGVDVEVHRGDVGGADVPDALVAVALEKFGRLDVLVNNAGVVVEELLVTMSDDEMERMISVNVRGPVRLSRAVVRPMLRQKAGSIINVSSVLAAHPDRGHAVYAGTKGFLESFTRALAMELGSRGIRVNAVAPGIIETEMSAAMRALAGEGLASRVGLRRIGTAAEVAEVVAFLASSEASYVTGAVVGVDGAFRGSA